MVLAKEPVNVGGFGGKVSWLQVQKFPNNSEVFYKTDLLMMQRLGQYSFINKLINKPYRIYVRHTEKYMTEPFQRVKYIVAEADTLEEIVLDWEILSNNIVPIFQECILSTRRITLKDLTKLCQNNRNTVHAIGEYEKFELPLVGIRFNYQKMIQPTLKHNDTGFLIHFSEVMPFFDIVIVPCDDTLLSDMLQFEIDLLQDQFKDLDIFHYQTVHLNYDVIHFGYELAQDGNILKYWCMMLIKNGFYFKFMIYSYKPLFHMDYFHDILMSLNFSLPKLKIHTSDGIMFTYPKDLSILIQKDDVVTIKLSPEGTIECVGSLTIQNTTESLVYLFKTIKEKKLDDFNSKSFQFQNKKCFIYEYMVEKTKHVCLMIVNNGKYYHLEVRSPILNQDSLKSIQTVFPTFQILEQ